MKPSEKERTFLNIQTGDQFKGTSSSTLYTVAVTLGSILAYIWEGSHGVTWVKRTALEAQRKAGDYIILEPETKEIREARGLLEGEGYKVTR